MISPVESTLRYFSYYLSVLCIFTRKKMKLLLISNSTNAGEAYLDYPKHEIQKFLGEQTQTVLFVPYAAVTFSYDEYENKVRNRLKEVGYEVQGIHHLEDPVKSVKEAQAIVVGGGNTWKLVRMLRENGLLSVIREKVQSGTPYVGWSAGANVACPKLSTTNDMPITDPKGFDTIALVPFQINPHYLDDNPANHAGETRETRIVEFIAENHNLFVVGLREGTMLRVESNSMKLIGSKTARIFKHGQEPQELGANDNFDFLLGK